jgi:hypothetical protein
MKISINGSFKYLVKELDAPQLPLKKKWYYCTIKLRNMTIESVLTIVSCCISGLVGIVLYRQIKSQKEVIDSYKNYIQTLDINKFREYVSVIEDIGEKRIIAERINLIIEKEQNKDKLIEHYERYISELAQFLVFSVNKMPIDYVEKIDLIKSAFPLTFPLIKNRIT